MTWWLIGFGLMAALAGCGSATKTVTVRAAPTTKTVTTTVTQPPTHSATRPAASTSTSSAATGAAAQSANNAVVSQAAQAPDNQAQLGADGIRKILVAKVGLNDQDSFNLSDHIDPGDNGGDCYVKLGADAINFEDQPENILRSPNGTDVVFAQSNTTTPLVRCLQAVRTALGW